AMASIPASKAFPRPNSTGSPSNSACGRTPERRSSMTQAMTAPSEMVSMPSALQRSFAFDSSARSPTPQSAPMAATDSYSIPPYLGSTGYGSSSLTTFLQRTEHAQQASILMR